MKSKGKIGLNTGICRKAAFTRADLAVVIGLVLLLALWGSYSLLGERGRALRCGWNLEALGKAMQHYADEHDGSLPAASVNIGKYQASWDMEIFPYLKPGLAKENNARLAQVVPRYFACPSDRLARSGTPRSYAMGENDMGNWPPDGGLSTGVGLNWDKPAVLRLLNKEALDKPESLPGLKLAEIPAPSETLLLTEWIAPGNIMGKPSSASVSGCSQQGEALPDGGRRFHGGRFNYLMVDGHVEWLSPLQTGALDGTAGIWTLKKGD